MLDVLIRKLEELAERYASPSIFDADRGILRSVRKQATSAAGNVAVGRRYAEGIPNGPGGPSGRLLGVIPAEFDLRNIQTHGEADVASGISLVFALANPAPVTEASIQQPRELVAEIAWGNGRARQVIRCDIAEGTRLSLHTQVVECKILDYTPPPTLITPDPDYEELRVQAHIAYTPGEPGVLTQRVFAPFTVAVGEFIDAVPQDELVNLYPGAWLQLLACASSGNIPAPTSVSPNSVAAGASIASTVSGSGFDFAPDPDAVVFFQPTEGTGTTGPAPVATGVTVNPPGTSIDYTLDATGAAPGIYDLYVLNPDPGCTAPILAAVEVTGPTCPTLTGVAPGTVGFSPAELVTATGTELDAPGTWSAVVTTLGGPIPVPVSLAGPSSPGSQDLSLDTSGTAPTGGAGTLTFTPSGPGCPPVSVPFSVTPF